MSEIEYASLFGATLVSEPWASSLADIERQMHFALTMPGPMLGHNPRETDVDKMIRLGILKERDDR